MAMYTGKPHFLFNQNRCRPVSGKKYENLLKHYAKLLDQEKTEGSSKWLTHAKEMAMKRVVKYGLEGKLAAQSAQPAKSIK